MKIIVAGKIVKYLDLKVTEKDGKKTYRATYQIKDSNSSAVIHVLGKELIQTANLQVGSSYILEGIAISMRHKTNKHRFVTNIYVTNIIKELDSLLL
jgi:hypothetical protein